MSFERAMRVVGTAKLAILALFLLFCATAAWSEAPSIRVGWVGAMSGTFAKYGAYQAALIAMDDINATGGVAGKKLELLFQDGKCNGLSAVNAAKHLIDVDKVNFIVGGHCSSESLPIANLAERAKVIQMAAITSSPKLTDAGDYIFRVTAPNTDGALLLLKHATETAKKRIGVIYEETEYAQGLAEFFRNEATRHGITIPLYEGFAPTDVDLRSVVTRAKAAKIDALYLSLQAPDAIVSLLKVLREQRVSTTLLANEIVGNTVGSFPQQQDFFDGIVFGEPEFDRSAEGFRTFEAKYRARFQAELPYGFYTAEAYDAVRVVAYEIAKCGEDSDKVKACLYDLKDYYGVSGPVAFDKNGDGVRRYTLKRISGGKIVPFVP